MVAWSTDTPRSCMSSSTWRSLNGYATYHRTQTRRMSFGKWAPVKLTMMALPLLTRGVTEGDHTSKSSRMKICDRSLPPGPAPLGHGQPCSETSHLGRSRGCFHERQTKRRGSFAQVGEVPFSGPLFIVL